MKRSDPRKVGSVCFDGRERRAYMVLWRDDYEGWAVEMECGRRRYLDSSWDPERGDRVIREGGWKTLEPEQINLFGLETSDGSGAKYP
jgi:hypothetical protein